MVTQTRAKQGYNTPISSWLYGSLGDFILQSIFASSLCEVLRPEIVTQLLEEHRAFRRDNSFKLFGLFVLSQNDLSDWN